MKAVVLETRGREAAILTADGSVRRVRGRYEVGQQFDYVGPGRPSVARWVAAAVAAALLLAGSAGMWINENYVACAEVSLDGSQTASPSIVYTLNRRNRVLSVDAMNDDAAAIVQTLNEKEIRFAPIEDAVERTVAVLTEQGYLDGEGADYMLTGVSADDAARQDAITARVEAAMTRADPALEYRIERTDRETAREARDKGMSPGRYAAWKRSDDHAPDDFAGKPAREIIGRGEETPDAPVEQEKPGNAPVEQEKSGDAPVEQEKPEDAPIEQEKSGDAPIEQEKPGDAPEKAEPADAAPPGSGGAEPEGTDASPREPSEQDAPRERGEQSAPRERSGRDGERRSGPSGGGPGGGPR